MPRRSPRSRRKPTGSPRVPRAGRARTRPGQGRTAERASTRTRAKRATTPRPAPAPAPRVRTRPGTQGRPVRVARPPARRARGRFLPPDPDRVRAVLGILERAYPDAITALDFHSPLQLLIATILSAQCTDERVNQVTPVLFEKYPDAPALAAAPIEDLESIVRSTGFYRNKARSIHNCCTDIVAKHQGQVPRTLEELTALHGVGRKTANVVLGNAFGIPGLVVDTHVTRLSNRLGLTGESDAVKIEHALMPIVPRDSWTKFSHWLILHGRKVCVARKPRCSICPLAPHCPRVGVTTSQ